MKECKNCNTEKPLSEFNIRKIMSDGRTNICKDCRNKRARMVHKCRRNCPKYVEKKRASGRKTYRKLYYKTKKKKRSPESQKKSTDKYRAEYPEKRKAKNSARRIKVAPGKQRHHWSYNECHFKDVIELSREDHYTIHTFLVYDKKSKMYRDKEGNLLDTRIKHENYIKRILIKEKTQKSQNTK